MVNAHLSAASDGHTRKRVARGITLRDGLSGDAASIETSPCHILSVVETSLARHQGSRRVKGDGPAHGIGCRGCADGAVPLNQLHGARRAWRTGQTADKTVAVHRDVPDVVVYPTLKIAEKRLG